MNKHLFVLILTFFLLTACSTTQKDLTSKNSAPLVSIKFSSSVDTNFTLENVQHSLKANIIEEVSSLTKKENYSVIAWNFNSYKTKNLCYPDKLCNLKVDKIGTQSISYIGNTFELKINGEVRMPYFCIAYKNMIFRNLTRLNGTSRTTTIEIPTPFEKKLSYDRCYASISGVYEPSYVGNGTLKAVTFSAYKE